MPRWAPTELVARAIGGDRIAVQDLIVAVWPGCFRLAATVIGDRSLAQDAAQEACVLIHRKVRTLRAAVAFDAWLYRIVMRESARARRGHAFERQPAYEAPSSDDAMDVDVWRALAALPPDLRDVVVLFYFDDLKSTDVAAILRIPHATVRTRLARARERLRGLLDDYGSDASPAHQEIQHHAI